MREHYIASDLVVDTFQFDGSVIRRLLDGMDDSHQISTWEVLAQSGRPNPDPDYNGRSDDRCAIDGGYV